jgi:hypothetical protein
MHKKIVTTAVIALVVGFGAGYLTHTSPAQTQGTRGTLAGANGGNFGGMMRGGATAGGGFLTGTVAAKDSGSITLNTRDGSSHVVLITPATTVSKSVTGAVSDVSVGATIIVSGTTNSDGSVSATLIQLRPTTSPVTQ